MLKVLSTLDYWEEFHKKYPNLEPFRAFIAQDLILTKIFNVIAAPNILFYAISDYPFEDKIKEAQSISPKNIEHLHLLSIEAGEDPKREKEAHWLQYLVSLYELVGTTLRLYSMLKRDATLSQNEIIDFINIRFRNHLAIDKTYIIEDTEGVQTIKIVIGRTSSDYKLIFENNNKLLVQFDLYEPTKKKIEETKNSLDIKSVINFQRFRHIGPIFDEICFGGDRRSNKYQVEFYFKNKMLGGFSYPLRKRYENLLRKAVKQIQKLETEGDMGLDPESLADEILFKKAMNYNPSTDVRPAGYFKKCFEYLKNEYCEKIGTTNLPGDPMPQEGAYPYCDEYCKTQKEHENQLPCEYETEEGYCKDPDKKKRRLIWDIEHSGPGLDEPVEDEEGNKTSKYDLLAKSHYDIDSIVTKLLGGPGFEKEESELFRLYFKDELTQDDIAKRLKISQSVVSERIKRLKKKIKKAIEDYLPV